MSENKWDKFMNRTTNLWGSAMDRWFMLSDETQLGVVIVAFVLGWFLG